MKTRKMKLLGALLSMFALGALASIGGAPRPREADSPSTPTSPTAPKGEEHRASVEEIRLAYSIQAPNREAALRELIRWAGEQKGFLFALHGDTVSLRLPAKIPVEQIEARILSQGMMVGRSIQREDRGARLAELAVQIRVKEKHLRDLQKLTGDAGLSQTLALEQELTRVQGELDALKGERRFILEKARTIQLQVAFSYSAPISPAGEPGYGWAGMLGVSELIGGFGE